MIRCHNNSLWYDCPSLTSVTISSRVTNVGYGAFYNCISLTSVSIGTGAASGGTSVTIPYSVTSIGDQAFYNCTSLTSVTIPNGVTSIGNGAFAGCASLTSVTIPTGVTSIGVSAFWNCASLTSVTIPNGVTSIGDDAFVYCTSLTSVTIPNGVTSIGNGAFAGCASLTSVTIPTGVTSIGVSAFEYCTSLTSVTIPNSVTSMGDNAFYECTSLTSVTIGSGVTSIGAGAFHDCTSLTSVSIPNSVTSIGGHAFENCASLTSVTIPNSVTSVGDYAFHACTSLTSITIGSGVTSIGYDAFWDCTSLTSVTIPNGVTSIRDGAFDSCTSLTSVTIPNGVTSIGDYAFFYCTSLTSVTIPSGVTIIGDDAFCLCTSLTSVSIPNSVSSIGDDAFQYCTSLTSVTIPNSVTSMGDNAFYECTSLTSVTIGSGVTSIGAGAFHDCTSLTSVTIPNSVTSIGDDAFEYCTSLTSVTIPNSVTSIGDYAFFYCTSLTSVTIPASVASIGSMVFFVCHNLTSARFMGDAPVMGADVFLYAADSFKVAYEAFKTGFSTPVWEGYPSVCIGYTPPTVVTGAANGITASSATLQGTVNPNGWPNSAWFEYRISGSDGDFAVVTLSPNDGLDAQDVSRNIGGLLPGSTYYYRLLASNSMTGTTPGEVRTFTTASLNILTFSFGTLGSATITGTNISLAVPYGTNVTNLAPTFTLSSGATCDHVSGTTCDFTNPVTYIVTSSDTLATSTYTVEVTVVAELPDMLNVSTYSGMDGQSLLDPISNLIAVTPSATGTTTSTIDYHGDFTSLPGSPGPGHFSVLWEGWFDVTKDGFGVYTFGTSSDDGSMLYLDLNGDGDFDDAGECIVSNNNYQGDTQATGSVDLQMKSVHMFIGFYQGDGGYDMRAAFKKGSDLEFGSLNLINTSWGYFFTADPYAPPQAKITNFGPGATVGTVASNAAGIVWSVPYGTNVAALTPTFTMSAGATCDHVSGTAYDFSSPVHYTVTSSDSLISNVYTVTVNVVAAQLPVVATGTATGITASAATLNGTVNPNGFVCTTQFEYGLTTAYGSTASVSLSPDNGATAQNVSAMLSDLQPATTYHYRLTATNGDGTGAGDDMTFATYPTVPYTYTITDGKVTITGYTGPGGVVDIPDIINGLPVIRIENNAFLNNTNLTSVTIPNGVNSIGEGAFEYCTSLTSVTIPHGVTSIGAAALHGCTSLSSVTIPDGITSIEAWTFKDCTSLASVTIPVTVTSIGGFAFDWCVSLTSVTIPNSVTMIWDRAFEHCTSLTSVIIPAGVTSIGDVGFSSCISLKCAYFCGDAPLMGGGVFDNSASGFTVYYYNGNAGFTSPTWMDYPAVNLGDPAAAKDILAFSFGALGPATITGTDIFLTVPYGTDLTSLAPTLAPTFTLPPGATCDHVSGTAYDFTSPVVYTVKASDFATTGNHTDYTVTVSVGPQPPGGVGTGLTLWLDASAPGTMSQTGDTVNQWRDKMGGSAKMTLRAGTPTLVASGIGGIPTVHFDSSSWMNDGVNHAAPVTVFYVSRETGGSNGRVLGAANNWLMGYLGEGRDRFHFDSWVLDSGLVADTNPHLYAATIQGGGLNTTVWGEGNLLASNDGGQSGPNNLQLNGYWNGGYELSDCDISEVVVYNRILSDNELNQVGGYLADKYALPTAYPSLTPQGWLFAFGLPGNPATIDQSVKTVTLVVPYGTNVAALTPTFTMSAGATCDHVSGTAYDFSSPVHYTVTSSDSLISNVYTVTVNVVAAQLPVVTTGTATGITATTATLNGTVNPNGFACTAQFEYGLTTAYGSTASVSLSPDNGATAQNVSAMLSDLQPATTYHYRLTATNGDGTGVGDDMTFATEATFWEFKYTIMNGAITITGYAGSGGVVVIPDTISGLPVIRIENNAFLHNTNLTSVTIPNSVTSIGDGAFAGCTSLSSVTIPASVASIGGWTFAGCTSLIEVAIPTSITSIGESAFQGCSSLGGVAIPASVSSIGRYAFAGTGSLASVTVDALNAAYCSVDGVLFDKMKTTLILYPGTKAGSYSIPNSVTYIADGAFAGCTNLTGVTIPDNVISIGDAAFNSCSSLTNITIPDSVVSIGRWSFEYCFSLRSIILGNGLISIGDAAFNVCSSLTSITIPASVTSIGGSAFRYCTSLTSITVDTLNSFYSSADGVLFNKSQSLLIHCPGGKGGSYAIPGSVTSIQDGSFEFCINLTSVTIPDTITSIGSWTFSGCTSLTSVTLPNSITSIVWQAFSNCTSLTSVIIPANVTILGDIVFAGCTRLKNAYFLGDAPAIGWGVFDGAASGFAVYYYNGKAGFTSPSWQGYPAVNLGIIAVEQPDGTRLHAGGASAFVGVTVGNTVTRTYTIRNMGTLDLTGLSVTKDGTNHSDFRVVQPTATTLEPGVSTTFEVTFTPSASGPRAAALHIASNDPIYNPFIINLLVDGGLQVNTYDTTCGASYLDPIANLMALTPSGTSTQLANIDHGDFVASFPGLTNGDTFMILWEGWFDVSKDGPGAYTFGTNSDDGSVIYLDLNGDGDFDDPGELVVNNNGLHSATTRTGTVMLSMDSVRIAIGFFENAGYETMAARFKKGSEIAYNSLDPIGGTSGHFFTTQPPASPLMAKLWNFGLPGNPAVMTGTDVLLTVPSGTDVTHLAPTYQVSALASCNKSSGTVQNFATPQTYIVTSADLLTTTVYTVTVIGDPIWINDGSALWSTVTNWGGGRVASGPGITANFNNLDITDDRTVSLGSSRTIGNLVFGDSDPTSAAGWILTGNRTNVLSLVGGSPTITVNALGTGKSAIIAATLGGTEGMTKAGSGTLLLSGINTYTGNTIVSAGTLNLADNARLKFIITNLSNNKITGPGSVNLDGDFTIDTSAVTVASGAWTLVDVATRTFGTTFSVAGTGWWSEQSVNVWTKIDGAGTWTFSESTGILTLASGLTYTDADGAITITGFTGYNHCQGHLEAAPENRASS